MIVKLLTEHHFEFLSLKGGCRGSSKSTHVKIPYCWKVHALAHLLYIIFVSDLLQSEKEACNEARCLRSRTLVFFFRLAYRYKISLLTFIGVTTWKFNTRLQIELN